MVKRAPKEVALTPPADLFNTIQCFPSSSEDAHAVHLCLPRTLSRSLNFTTTASNDRLTPTDDNSGSTPQSRDIRTQMLVVKTCANPQELREEAYTMDQIHQGSDNSNASASSYITQSQFTTTAPSSWMCMRPIFGPSLKQFSITGAVDGGVPNYLIAQIFLGLLDALEVLHAAGYAHNNLTLSNVMLNMYPKGSQYRYRNYPDVLLVGWSHAKPISCSGIEEDARGMLRIMVDLIRTCSDVSRFLRPKAAFKTMISYDAMVSLLHDMEEVLIDDGMFGLENVRQQFGVRFEEIRNMGPSRLSYSLLKLLHSDLVSDAELESALREPLKSKTKRSREEMQEPTQDERAAKKRKGCAGRKTKLTKLRFTTRKRELQRIIEMDGAGEKIFM